MNISVPDVWKVSHYSIPGRGTPCSPSMVISKWLDGLVLIVDGQWRFTLQWTSDTEHLTNLFKILQCPSTGAMIDQVPHREQCQCVKELEDGVAWLVD